MDFAALALLAPLALAPQDTPQVPGDPTPSSPSPEPARELQLEVRVSPLADLWFQVRSLAAERARDPLLDPAIEAMRELERELGSPLFFGWVEGHLETAADAGALLASFSELPETQTARGLAGPSRIELRGPARAVAAALVDAEDAWRSSHWPARQEQLEARAALLHATFAETPGRQALADLAAGFGLSPGARAVPVLLVLRAPAPGAVTHRRAGGGGSVFASVAEFSDSVLLEVVLHEVLHAMDVLGTPSLLTELRSALARAGLPGSDPRQRTWVHTLFFLHAEDIVRRHLAPRHGGYGTEHGYYVKVAEVVAALEPIWKAHRAGELGREELVDAIVEAAVPPGDDAPRDL